MARNLTKLLMCALFCSLPAVAAWADGAVYAMTNAVMNNQIVVYHRGRDGTLTFRQMIPTRGGGSGLQLSPPDSLGSQGALILDDEHRFLFAVNTETLAENSQDCQEGTITSFLVGPNGRLTFADRVNSSGLFPNSLTFKSSKRNGERDHGKGGDGGLLYVLNAGGPGSVPNPAGPASSAFCGTSPNITGFSVDGSGRMSLLPNSVQAIIDPGPLDGTGSGVNCPPGGFAPATSFFCGLNPPAFPRSPAQIGFTPDGTQLVVTVKGTNKIYVFPVGENGAPTVTQAPGPALPTYFGFTFDRQGDLLLTEPFGKATTIPLGSSGALSSFTITAAGVLHQISASVGDGGTAACWIALEPITGRYAYVSNNLSNPGSLSSYTVANNGTVALRNAVAAPGSGPADLAVVADGAASFLYVLDAGSGTVGAFRINLTTGDLTSLAAVPPGLPVNDGAAGLAAY